MSACQIMTLATSKSLILMAMLTLSYAVPLVNIYFIGNLNNPKLLAGVGLGNTLVNIIFFGMAQGICDGSVSMISQAFGAG